MQTLFRKYKKVIIAGSVVFLFIVLLYSILRQTEQSTLPRALVKAISFQGTQIEERKKGRLVWRIESRQIKVDQDTQQVYVKQPQGKFCSAEGMVMSFHASACLIDRKQAKVIIEAPIEITTSQGDRLQTKGNIVYNGKTETITGGPVVIYRSDGIKLQANSFISDVSLQHVKLKGQAKLIKGE
ncbi:LPS export ABC transporter periplasmic protein LptC [uncultured Megasphaera sp.]|uniref:LPS export ABC transporter periplasmic protein LptC n=1 Tax=uncultured Megasphaera sp. TaxID=165188 RepID=UPI00259A06D7|nr:LPS export ABC transporter periplasmic protein LptC [uncultured Megasphaera sp.]